MSAFLSCKAKLFLSSLPFLCECTGLLPPLCVYLVELQLLHYMITKKWLYWTSQYWPTGPSLLFQIFSLLFCTVGTIWMQQILVKVMEAVNPEWGEDVTNRQKVPWLEGRTLDNPLRERAAPRILRTHLPPDMLPRGVKDKQIKATIFNIQLLI